jgi:Glycosyl hydrolase family 63 C-terminal domain
MRDAARALLQANTETVEFEGRVWRYSIPAKHSYPHQWLWDSSFHAVVWSLFDPARGCDELRSLFRWQWPNGLIPHVVFWHPERVNERGWHYLESADIWSFLPNRKPRTTALTQPPVLATAVERLVLAGAEDFLSEALPVLERYYRYLASERDPDQDGLISTIVQFETGLDFSPAYDRALRAGPRAARKILVRSRLVEIKNKLAGYDLSRIFARNDHAEDVLVNTIWIDNLKVLARLARRAERPELATWAEAKATQALQSLLERAWDPGRGLFFNLVGSAEIRPEAKTIQCLLPLLLEDLPTDVAERLLAHLTDPHEFWSSYPVPSVALDEPSYTDDSHIHGLRLIWRGPCSMNTNWFLHQGLLRHGERGYASQLAQRSRELVERGDFNEFYDARSGRPVGAYRFGWATLVADFCPLPAESPPASPA